MKTIKRSDIQEIVLVCPYCMNIKNRDNDPGCCGESSDHFCKAIDTGEELLLLNEVKVVEKPICKLIGEDGNVFNIIGIVSKTLKRADQADQAKEFQAKAIKCRSYEEVLVLVQDYVDVEEDDEDEDDFDEEGQ